MSDLYDLLRPENLPRQYPLNLKEQFGLLMETRRAAVPHSYYRIFQLIYFFQGVFSSYFHIELCKEDHQPYAYRHKPSDTFLRMTSFCCECVFCPLWVFEHTHRPSKKCNAKCSARPVYRPVKMPVLFNDHNCFDHIDIFPPYFVRRMLLQYPNMPFSPFFRTPDHHRISANIIKNGTKYLEEQMKEVLKPSNVEAENLDVDMSFLFNL